MEKLERTLSDVQEDLSQELPESSSQPKKVKKVAKGKKKVKKANGEAKAFKKSAKASSKEGVVLLTDLASEAGITGASARRKLRSAQLSPEGRWTWEEGSKALKEARKALGLDA